MVDGAIPVRSFLDVPREATHKRLRNVSELAAFVQSAPFSSTLPFGFETTPADRETTWISKSWQERSTISLLSRNAFTQRYIESSKRGKTELSDLYT